MGSGHKARKLGRAPWRIDGSIALLTEDSREAGVRIEIEPRGAVVLAIKKLDRLYGSLAEIVDAEGRPAFRLLGFVPVDQGLQEQVPFSLVVHEDRVRAVLGGRPVGGAIAAMVSSLRSRLPVGRRRLRSLWVWVKARRWR